MWSALAGRQGKRRDSVGQRERARHGLGRCRLEEAGCGCERRGRDQPPGTLLFSHLLHLLNPASCWVPSGSFTSSFCQILQEAGTTLHFMAAELTHRSVIQISRYKIGKINFKTGIYVYCLCLFSKCHKVHPENGRLQQGCRLHLGAWKSSARSSRVRSHKSRPLLLACMWPLSPVCLLAISLTLVCPNCPLL